MASNEMSKIEWTHYTFNPWWGCAKVSAGCKNCYAEAWDARFKGEHWGENAPRKFMSDEHWKKPLKWNRQAEAAGVRRRVFCASMADVLEEHADSTMNMSMDSERHRLWKMIEKTQHLDWLLLTKRPENHEMVPLTWQSGSRRPPNVWLGTTAENQEQADIRIPHLLKAKWPALRFVSYEPALESINLRRWIEATDWCDSCQTPNTPQELDLCPECGEEGTLISTYGDLQSERYQAGHRYPIGPDDDGPMLNWVIAGAESGLCARPMNEEWVRNIRDQCANGGVPFFYKQKAEDGMKISLPELDGVVHAEFPVKAFCLPGISQEIDQ